MLGCLCHMLSIGKALACCWQGAIPPGLVVRGLVLTQSSHLRGAAVAHKCLMRLGCTWEVASGGVSHKRSGFLCPSAGVHVALHWGRQGADSG